MPETKNTKEETKASKDLQEFLEAGAHFGHKKSSVHPGMMPYIFGVRNNIHIIDVAHTQKKLEEANKFIKELISNGKIILFVGTKVPVRNLVKDIAEETKMPYVVNRWFGGTLTNWETISERVQFMKDLKEKMKSKEWEKYTKHERLKMKKLFDKLHLNLGGIKNMSKLPDALFVVGTKEDAIALREAAIKGIPTIGIVDTNVDPSTVTHPIPSNDDSVSAVKLILSKVKDVMLKNAKSKPATKKTVAKPKASAQPKAKKITKIKK